MATLERTWFRTVAAFAAEAALAALPPTAPLGQLEAMERELGLQLSKLEAGRTQEKLLVLLVLLVLLLSGLRRQTRLPGLSNTSRQLAVQIRSFLIDAVGHVSTVNRRPIKCLTMNMCALDSSFHSRQ